MLLCVFRNRTALWMPNYTIGTTGGNASLIASQPCQRCQRADEQNFHIALILLVDHEQAREVVDS